jgi:hypothetical protein
MKDGRILTTFERQASTQFRETGVSLGIVVGVLVLAVRRWLASADLCTRQEVALVHNIV